MRETKGGSPTCWMSLHFWHSLRNLRQPAELRRISLHVILPLPKGLVMTTSSFTLPSVAKKKEEVQFQENLNKSNSVGLDNLQGQKHLHWGPRPCPGPCPCPSWSPWSWRSCCSCPTWARTNFGSLGKGCGIWDGCSWHGGDSGNQGGRSLWSRSVLDQPPERG